MKGTYFLGNKQFETREVVLRKPGAGEVVVKVAACGICGTDVHIYHGHKGSAEVVPPVILGHEFAGVVTEIGPDVDTVKVGDHVTVDPNIYCGKCHFCKIGKKQLCSNLQAIGVNRDGGFAEYAVVPQEQCFQLDKEIPLQWGAMAEPLACCLHGIERIQIRTGDSVCVIGGGPIGLLMVQLARLSGAGKVIISEPVEIRRKIGLQVGACAAIDPFNESLTERICEICGTDGVDVVIECVGNPRAAEQAFEAAGRGAGILLFSVPAAGSTYTLHLEDIYQKELRVVGSMINPDTHERAVQLINNREIILEPLLTHSYPVDKVEDAIIKQTENDSIKVIVEP